MANYDRVLIDPSSAELARSLTEAAEGANQAARERRLDWPPEGLAELLASAAASAEGWKQFNGGTGKGRSGEARSVAVLAWWSDRVGRKHHRIVGRRGPFNNAARRNLLSSGEERPALWLVYPDRVFLRQRGSGWGLVAVCACGAVGSPEELGWAGQCCGPCHDRNESGDAPLPALEGPAATTLPGQRTQPASLRYSPSGDRLLVRGLWFRTVRVWDAATEQSQEWGAPNVFIHDMVPTAGAPLALTSNAFGSIGFLNLAHGEVQWPVGGNRRAFVAAFSPDGKTAAWVPAAGNAIELWDVPAFTPRATLQAPGLDTRLLAFSPDGQALAAACDNGSVRHWSLSSQEEGPVLRDAPEMPAALAFSWDRRVLAAACEDGSVHWWDTATGKARSPLRKHAAGRTVVAFSPDGRLLATAGSDTDVRFWDVASQREIATFRWHCGGVQALAFSPAGGWLATIASDDRVKLWPCALLLGP